MEKRQLECTYECIIHICILTKIKILENCDVFRPDVLQIQTVCNGSLYGRCAYLYQTA